MKNDSGILSKKRRNISLEQLPIDVLADIFMHLPFKSVITCKILNKKYNELISEQSFVVSFSKRFLSRQTSLILHIAYSLNFIQFITPSKTSYFMPMIINPPKPHYLMQVRVRSRVIASCNGLLLTTYDSTIFCVCNPITKQYKLIKPIFSYDMRRCGLAVDLVKSLLYPHYKVVYIYAKENDSKEYYFHMFKPEEDSWTHGSRMPLSADEKDTLMDTKAVYLNGSLHWLRKYGSIVVFDTEKEHAHMIRSPPGYLPQQRMWFGSVQGMITIVATSLEETVIYTLADYQQEYWVVTARIESKCINNGNPVLFDGEQLIVRPSSPDTLISSYHVKKKRFEKIGQVLSRNDDNESFDYFSPSLAKVEHFNHADHNNKEIERPDHIKQTLDGFANLFTPWLNRQGYRQE